MLGFGRVSISTGEGMQDILNLDFQKAIDRQVPHQKLLKELSYYRLGGKVSLWNES